MPSIFCERSTWADGTAPAHRVVVVGGGNVAIDAARVAKRVGAESVTVVYRRTAREMPAYEDEIEGAREEGIEIHYLTVPVSVVAKDGHVAGLECIRTELGEPDASGRRRPVPVEGSQFVIDCDAVIPAIGQRTDTTWSTDLKDLKWTRRQTLSVNRHTGQTSIAHIFAGGDAVTGPATVIEAVAQGHRAAEAMHCFLEGGDMQAPCRPTRAKSPVRPAMGGRDRRCGNRASKRTTDTNA